MSLTKQTLRDALTPSLPPGGQVIWTSVCETFASAKVQLTTGAATGDFDAYFGRALRTAADAAKAADSRLDSLIVDFVDDLGNVVAQRRFGNPQPPAGDSAPKQPVAQAVPQGHTPIPGLKPAAPTPPKSALPGVKHIIAVGAGKGGVGKSTIALNLAVGLARRGHSVGLLDGDIYGPSMPTMLGLSNFDAVAQRGMLQPFFVHGIKSMTIGKLVEPDKPLIWRGPMAHGAFKQLTEQTEWGDLDYLVIDLPPGTGDVALTMAQMLRLTGAVVVCTPQQVAQDDAVRAARMFQQLGVEVLGVVENMSYFVGDDGKVYDIFGRGGAEVMAQRLNLPFLGGVPITMSLRVNSDKGDPSANFEPTDAPGRLLRDKLQALVGNVESQVALAQLRQGQTRPTLSIS